MKQWYLPLVAAAIVAPACAQAQDLQVSIRGNGSRIAANQDVTITLTYRNSGQSTLHLLKWYLPGQELQEPLFEVRRDGKAVDYLGPRYKRRAPSSADLVALAPGASISRSVKLSDYYDMSQSGNFSVRFLADSQRVLGKPASRGLLAESLVGADVALASNELRLWAEGRDNKLLKQAQEAQQLSQLLERGLASSVTYAANCSATQQSGAGSGIGAASSMANEATAYLSGTPGGTQRYTTWFGKYSLTNWNTAKSHFVNIKGALDGKPISIDCGCTEAGTYAYVYPTQPYKIYLCGAFWNAPTSGTDSKGGTIVHELSHFNVVASTDDHAYGQTAAKKLAISSPKKALDNADNHEYFAENTPALP